MLESAYRNNMKKIISVLGALCFGMTLLTGCGDDSSADNQAASVVADKVDSSITFDGTVSARKDKIIFAEESGTVKEILFEEGDEIENDIIIRYTVPDLTEDEPETDEKNSTAVKVNKVKEKTIRSGYPASIITGIYVAEGQPFAEGTPLIEVSKKDDYYILSEVLENFINDIKTDSAVTIIPNSDKFKSITGKITKIYPMAYQNENGDQVVKVEVTMNHEEDALPLGYTVKIKVE